MSHDLDTERLTLVAQTPDDVAALLSSMSEEDRQFVSSDWLRQVSEAKAIDPWIHGFVVVRRGSTQAIGNCGFKGPPDASGAVEVAYGVAPEHQGKGYATEMTEALVEFAFAEPRVTVVLAHTMPEDNASTRVLAKSEFVKTAEVDDPADGKVWRWQRRR